MEAMARSGWSDERLDDLKASVDRLESWVDSLQHSMVMGFLAMGTMMFAGFGALITLFATHF